MSKDKYLSRFSRQTEATLFILEIFFAKRAVFNVTTAFAILEFLEYELLKGFLVQGRQQSFGKFSILPNILDLE